MINIYRVEYSGRYIGHFRAVSPSDAVNQAYMKTGSASRYTGRSRDNYKAILELR